MKLNTLIKQHSPLKNIISVILNIAFWIVIFVIVLVNFYAAGSIFTYGENHDHHLAFFSYLGGMAQHGILPGIDFYSPHSIFIPIIFGIFFKILGVSQINLGITDGIMIFITMIFIYKSARLVMPDIFAKLAILTLLLSHSGRDLPWFNDVIMLFVAIGVYYLVAYINDKKPYRLIIVGIICFTLPYLRQQGLVICLLFIIIPTLLYYIKNINEKEYKMMIKKILSAFIVCNIALFIFVLLWNGTKGLEILFSSLTSLVDMSQPAIGYDNNIAKISSDLFDYTAQGMDWHGYFTRYLSYWFIVIAPCLYFVYRPINLLASQQAILKEDTIRFIVSLVTLSTIIFNFPINEDARMRVQFGIGIWLFIDTLRLCFYNKNIKILSFIAIAIAFLLINHSKLSEFITKSMDNFTNITTLKDGYIKIGNGNPYSGMKFRENYANHLLTLIDSLQTYYEENPDKETIFDGELVDINAYLLLLFSGPKVALQHKFPYRYGSFDRKSFFNTIEEEYDDFIKKNQPIIIGCKMEYKDDNWIPENYKILNKINDSCNILVPQTPLGKTINNK